MEGIIISVNANKNSIMQLEGRNTKVNKFGNSGGNSGMPRQCLERTVERGEDGDSDVDGW